MTDSTSPSPKLPPSWQDFQQAAGLPSPQPSPESLPDAPPVKPEWAEFHKRTGSQAQRLQDLGTERAKPPGLYYQLAVWADGKSPELEVFTDAQSLAARLTELESQDVGVLPFWGVRLSISSRPFRYLALPEGGALPLFNAKRAGLPTLLPESQIDFRDASGGPVTNFGPPEFSLSTADVRRSHKASVPLDDQEEEEALEESPPAWEDLEDTGFESPDDEELP